MDTIDLHFRPEIHELLKSAKEELHQQQLLVPDIDCPMIRDSIIKLLSSGLRTFCWLEKEVRGAAREGWQVS